MNAHSVYNETQSNVKEVSGSREFIILRPVLVREGAKEQRLPLELPAGRDDILCLLSDPFQIASALP